MFKYSFHPYGDFEKKNTLFVLTWTIVIHLRDLVADVHPFKESYRLFGLDEVHPFKESYHLFSLDDVHPSKESYRLFYLDNLFGLSRRK